MFLCVATCHEDQIYSSRQVDKWFSEVWGTLSPLEAELYFQMYDFLSYISI